MGAMRNVMKYAMSSGTSTNSMANIVAAMPSEASTMWHAWITYIDCETSIGDHTQNSQFTLI